MMAQVAKKRYSSQRKRKYRKTYRKRQVASSRYLLKSNQAVYRNQVNKIFRATSQEVKCWSLYGVGNIVNLPLSIVNGNQCYVQWYTTFLPNVGFWNSLGGYQVPPEDQADHKEQEWIGKTHFFVRGGEIILTLTVLDTPSKTDSNIGNLINAVAAKPVHFEIYMCYSKGPFPVSHTPDGPKPFSWHPMIIPDIANAFWIPKKPRRATIYENKEKVFHFKFRPQVYSILNWESKKNWPIFVVKALPGTTTDTQNFQIKVELAHRICFNPIRERSNMYLAP